MENQNTIITIDPGSNGSIVVFDQGRIISARMPKSINELSQYFIRLNEQFSNIVVFIEKVQAYSTGDDAPGKKFGINKMLANYNQLLTVIQIQGFRFIEIYPISWQTTLGLKIKRPPKMKDHEFKTLRKNLYKDYAIKCFPGTPVTLANSDALCLIQFAFVKMSEDIEWIRSRIQGGKSDQIKIIL